MKYYIVWNKARNEAAVFDDYDDACHAAGKRKSNFCSTLADAFRDIYDEKLKVEEVDF